MSLHKGSRYLLTSIVQPQNAGGDPSHPAFVDIAPRVTSYAQDDVFITVDESRGWALLGRKYLKDANSWWVIADMSEVVDPFTELTPGKVLRAPSFDRFFMSIYPGEENQ